MEKLSKEQILTWKTVQGANFHMEKLSKEQILTWKNCPRSKFSHGKLSKEQILTWKSCPRSKFSYGKTVQGANSHMEKLSKEQILLGQFFHMRICSLDSFSM